MNPSSVMHINFATGKLEPVVTAERFALGRVLTYEDRANPIKRYVVTSTEPEHYGQPVLCEDGHTSHCAPSCVGVGGWRDTGKTLDAAALAAFTAAARATGEKLKAEAEAASAARAAADTAERARILAENPHLERADTSKKSRHALAAANIRRELARAFPGHKFSVTSDSFSMGDSVTVSWTDGPTTAEIDAIINKYERGSFNGMEDIYEYNRAVWPQVFGSTKYASSSRHISPDAMRAVAADLGHDPAAVDVVQMVIRTAESPGHWGDETFRRECYARSYYTAPMRATPAATAAPAAAAVDGVTVTENAEKGGIEIRFPAKPPAFLLQSLKDLGWRWSRFSSCWYAKASAEARAFAQNITATFPNA